jgi:hypothetical protein
VTIVGVDDLVRLEIQVWHALVQGDAAADALLLSEDFLGVYPSGFADREDHVRQLADGPTIADFEITEPRIIELSDSAVLLSYRAAYQPASATGISGQEAMYVSSLWCRRDNRWINVFSQDTPANSSPT